MLVHSESNSLLLKVKVPQRVLDLIPKARLFDYDGHNVAVRHGLDEVKVLRNIGINAPPPILYHYHWPGPPNKRPMLHQRQTAAFFTLYNKCFCFNQPGTAKTASSLWAADYLMNIGLVNKVLIVAPNTSLDVTWMEEIFAFLMHRRAAMLVGSSERRHKLLATDSHFYVINHHGLETIADELKRRKDIDLVIGDECDVYRTADTNLYKVIEEVTKKRRTWLMSGTPCPNAPTDAWALARLVSPSRVPQYFGQWRRQTMYQVSTYKWMPKPDSYEMAFNAMQPAIRYMKKDCIDLPPMITMPRSADITPQQKKALSQMKNQAVMEARAGVVISAINAADKINKMRQVLCGVVKDTATGLYEEVPHQLRVDVLLHEIAKAPTKVLVIVPFKGIIAALHRDIVTHYSCEIINGDVSRTERTAIVKRFKNTPDPHVLLCHPKVMSHSLNLAEAATIIFYAPIYSNGEFGQVIERIARPGQEQDMTIVRIGAHPLEWEIYRILDTRSMGQESILSLYHHQVLGE